MRQLGDMTVMTDSLPASAWRALAAIAARLHQSYPATETGQTSKDKCLFASLAMRDFLVQAGWSDATVAGCGFYIEAHRHSAIRDSTTQIWSIGVGTPGQPNEENKFNGHIVVLVPSLELLIDPTLYQVIRPHWGDAITGMMATPYNVDNDHRFYHQDFKRPVLAAADCMTPDRTVSLLWLHRPELHWRRSPDFRQKSDRRMTMTKAMLDAYQRPC